MKKFLVILVSDSAEKIISQHDTLDSAKQAGKSFNDTLRKSDGVVSVIEADVDADGNFLDSKRIIYKVFV